MKLFEPIKLGKVEIKNRIVMPGMETNLGDENGNVTPQIIEYYKQRAKGGTGLIIVEGVFFDKIGRGTLNMLSIESSKQIKGLKQLAEVIHTYGAKVLGQVLQIFLVKLSVLSLNL
ncbi:MAG: oxidoreductase [Candidatus Heimdallarchaeota archaeon]